MIIPAYRQELTIHADLEQIDHVLAGTLPCSYELICVVDGRVDATFEEAQQARSANLTVVGYEQNRGKGWAIRYGFAHSRGDPVAFLDAGMEIDPASLGVLLSQLDQADADIVVGSKLHPLSSVESPPGRRFLSTGYRLLVAALLRLPVSDTQAGIKLFRRTALETILPGLRVAGYAMDVEMLCAARASGFANIVEAPIRVRLQPSSSQIRGKAVARMLWDTLGVFLRFRIPPVSRGRGSGF